MFVTLQMGLVLLNFTELDQFWATHSPLLMINSRGNVTSCFTTWDLLIKLLPFVTGQGRIQEFLTGGSKLWFRKDCWFFCGKLLLPHTPYRQSWFHVLIPWPLTVYLSSTRTGYTLETSSSCAWLQRLYRFRQHQCQGHDVSAWVQVLTTADQTSCFWDMTWFVASQKMNAQLPQN